MSIKFASFEEVKIIHQKLVALNPAISEEVVEAADIKRLNDQEFGMPLHQLRAFADRMKRSDTDVSYQEALNIICKALGFASYEDARKSPYFSEQFKVDKTNRDSERNLDLTSWMELWDSDTPLYSFARSRRFIRRVLSEQGIQPAILEECLGGNWAEFRIAKLVDSGDLEYYAEPEEVLDSIIQHGLYLEDSDVLRDEVIKLAHTLETRLDLALHLMMEIAQSVIAKGTRSSFNLWSLMNLPLGEKHKGKFYSYMRFPETKTDGISLSPHEIDSLGVDYTEHELKETILWIEESSLKAKVISHIEFTGNFPYTYCRSKRWARELERWLEDRGYEWIEREGRDDYLKKHLI